jgi:hypothetical protein
MAGYRMRLPPHAPDMYYLMKGDAPGDEGISRMTGLHL